MRRPQLSRLHQATVPCLWLILAWTSTHAAHVTLDDQSPYIDKLCSRDLPWTCVWLMRRVGRLIPLMFFTTARSNNSTQWFNHTESLHEDNTSWYTFNFTGSSFAIYGVKTKHRGGFMVSIDDWKWSTRGDAYDSTQEKASEGFSQMIYNSPDLEHTEHVVRVRNWGNDSSVAFPVL